MDSYIFRWIWLLHLGLLSGKLFKIIKYRFPENKIQYYLNYVGILTSNQIENNKTKYEHITNNQTEEYIVAKNEYIYVLSFTNLKTEEINGIMKTIYYYK